MGLYNIYAIIVRAMIASAIGLSTILAISYLMTRDAVFAMLYIMLAILAGIVYFLPNTVSVILLNIADKLGLARYPPTLAGAPEKIVDDTIVIGPRENLENYMFTAVKMVRMIPQRPIPAMDKESDIAKLVQKIASSTPKPSLGEYIYYIGIAGDSPRTARLRELLEKEWRRDIIKAETARMRRSAGSAVAERRAQTIQKDITYLTKANLAEVSMILAVAVQAPLETLAVTRANILVTEIEAMAKNLGMTTERLRGEALINAYNMVAKFMPPKEQATGNWV